MVNQAKAIREVRKFNRKESRAKAVVKSTDMSWGTEVHVRSTNSTSFTRRLGEMAAELDACMFINDDGSVELF